MNIVTVSFNTTVRQMTEMFQWKTIPGNWGQCKH